MEDQIHQSNPHLGLVGIILLNSFTPAAPQASLDTVEINADDSFMLCLEGSPGYLDGPIRMIYVSFLMVPHPK